MNESLKMCDVLDLGESEKMRIQLGFSCSVMVFVLTLSAEAAVNRERKMDVDVEEGREEEEQVPWQPIVTCLCRMCTIGNSDPELCQRCERKSWAMGCTDSEIYPN